VSKTFTPCKERKCVFKITMTGVGSGSHGGRQGKCAKPPRPFQGHRDVCPLNSKATPLVKRFRIVNVRWIPRVVWIRIESSRFRIRKADLGDSGDRNKPESVRSLESKAWGVQEYLAHNKTPTPLGPL
jgi:hypothetical protein